MIHIQRFFGHRPSITPDGTHWQPTPHVHMNEADSKRRFVPDVPYLLPKDRAELRRLDFQHYVLRQVFGGNTVVPLEQQVRAILDVGTGTGRWAYDMARQCPWATVTGLDLDPPSTHSILIPSNYCFQQGNILHGLPFPDASFDLTHQRFLVAAIPAACWPGVVRELVRVTRPGGCVELVEGGDCYHQVGPALQQFLAWGKEISQRRGFDCSIVRHLDQLLQRERLHQVHMKVMRVPVGNWGGRVGELLAKDMLAGMAALQVPFCTQLSLPVEVFAHIVQALPEEWNRYRTDYEFYCVTGRR